MKFPAPPSPGGALSFQEHRMPAAPTQALLPQIAQNAARHMFAFSHAVKDKA